MKLNRRLLVGICVACVPAANSWAGPQTDDLTVKAVEVSSDDGGKTDEAERSKQPAGNGTAKEQKRVQIQLNKGPVVLMLTKDAADKVAKDVDDKSEPPKIWLGIGLKEIEGDLAAYLGSSEGVFIESVFPDSPAEAAKLQAGDVVLAFNGEKVRGPAELVAALRAVAPVAAEAKNGDAKNSDAQSGDAQSGAAKGETKAPTYPSISLTIMRRGQEMKVELKPSARPGAKAAAPTENDAPLESASIFKFGQPEQIYRRLANPLAKKQLSVVVVVKEDGDETIARIQRDGDAPAKIVITRNKQDREITEDQLDQLPEKVQQAIKKALKSTQNLDDGQPVEGKLDENKAGESQPGSDPQGKARQARDQALDEVREQLENALKQVGGGQVNIELKGLTESLNGMGRGGVIVIDPAKLQDIRKMAEEAKTHAKSWAEAGSEQARGFATMPEQLKQLKQQVSELSQQVEMLKEELKASKK